MSRFSVIVPMLGPTNLFEDTLASVLRHRPAETNVIVVHDGGYLDPYGLSEEVQFVAADRQSRLQGYLNIGLCYAAGPFTVIARPGIELDENWEAGMVQAFQDEEVAAISPVITSGQNANRIVTAGVRIDATGTRRLVASGQRIKSANPDSLNASGPSSWLGAYRTNVLKSLAPLDESIQDLFVDVDIALSLNQLGFKNIVSTEFVGVVDQSDWIIDESKQAHGVAAQRASQRYGELVSTGSLGNLVADLVRSPLSPWRMKHAMQRLFSRQWNDHDLSYSNRLARLTTEKPWFRHDENSVPAVRRRAA